MSPEERKQAVSVLAELLASWLETLGFDPLKQGSGRVRSPR